MRLTWYFAAIVASLGLAAGAVAVTASPAMAGGGRYVALGSSYSAGPGIAPTLAAGCGRSGRNYANLVAQAWKLTLVDVACDGATAGNVLATPQRLRGGVSAPPQIDSVTPDTTLVTVTVGGNDIGYIKSMIGASMCQISLHAGSGHTCRTANAPSASDFNKVETSLVEVVSAVRSRAPKAQVVLVDYLPVLDPNGGTCALLPLSAAQQAPLEQMYRGVVAATAQAARASDALLVQASDAGRSHTACSATPWVTGFQFPIPYHPNAVGMAAVAQLIDKTLTQTTAQSTGGTV